MYFKKKLKCRLLGTTICLIHMPQNVSSVFSRNACQRERCVPFHASAATSQTELPGWTSLAAKERVKVRRLPLGKKPHKTYPCMWTEIGPLVVSVMGASDRYSVRYGADR